MASGPSGSYDQQQSVPADWRADPELAPWRPVIERRAAHFQSVLDDFVRAEGSLHAFCFVNGLDFLGLHRASGGTWVREWAPSAVSVACVGDFNGWCPTRHPCTASATHAGVWEVFIPDDASGRSALPVGARYKLSLRLRRASSGGEPTGALLCMPAWALATEQDASSAEYCAIVPPELDAYAWRHPRPRARPASLRVYEAHVGISSAEPVIASWAHFREQVLPRVAALGYTALLLMAVAEHGYYASFGFQVTCFFAPSCRFGPPHELQALVDAAHGLGLLVLFELVDGGHFHLGRRALLHMA
jgi:1,4-alpha-glucan branching enzyme